MTIENPSVPTLAPAVADALIEIEGIAVLP